MAGLVIEDALVTWLEALPALSSQGAKVYPWARAPQDPAVRLYVLFKKITGGRIRSLTSPAGAARVGGVSHPRIQLDVYGRDYETVRDLGAAVVEALDGFSGDMAGRTVQFAGVNDDFDQLDDTDPAPRHGTEIAEHRYLIDFTIWFIEG